jgi:fatty acid desaturase
MRVEWPTLLLIFACYAAWLAALFLLPQISVLAAIVLCTLCIALHSSLQHEVTHGHPFNERRLGEVLVFGSLNLVIPYLRFRDTHLAHHMDARLTDPYEDPESNYLDPAVWRTLPRWAQRVLSSTTRFWAAWRSGRWWGRSLHGDGLAADPRGRPGGAARLALAPAGVVAVILPWCPCRPCRSGPTLLSAYLGLSILKIRTFLEHQAHERARPGR